LLTNLLTSIPRSVVCLVIFFFLHLSWVRGQDTIHPVQPEQDTLRIVTDSSQLDDTTSHPVLDTLKRKSDTLKGKKAVKSNALKSKVEYAAKDSLRFDIQSQKVFLFNNVDIKYEKIDLKSGYVEIDFPKKFLYATFTKDSAGKEVQDPDFAEGTEKIKSKVLNYNYDTKRGYIQYVFTKQDEGYLHGKIVKKMENDVTYMKDGSYTTCSLEENPHYEFKFGKAKVIPGKKIITGPAYLIIAGVPVPIGVPFGYFPNRIGRRSGIEIPAFSESTTKGFGLSGGGYYWAASPYFDVNVLGDIWSRGSWALDPIVNYKYRYHYSGKFSFKYAINRLGAADSPDFSKSTDFSVQWTHTQDTKARPHSNFSANVNIVSQNFNKNNPVTNTQSYLSNTFSSSVNYSTIINNNYNLNINFSHNQNTLNKSVNITFPQLTFSVNQFFPFRRKEVTGKIRWYENINVRYNLNAINEYSTTDTTIFRKKKWWNDMNNGVTHSATISSGSIRILKHFTLNTGVNLTDRNYLYTIRQSYIPNPHTGSLSRDTLKVDTIRSLANSIDGNAYANLGTIIYGMFQFKKGPIVAIRHMLTPSISFTYTPDFGSSAFGYWRAAANDTNRFRPPPKYSIFQGSLAGTPASVKSGLIAFSLRNSLEMKVRSKKDTITGTKKISLIDQLIISENYDVTKDSMQWSLLSISGNTTLFKALHLTYSGSLDPYARDTAGRPLKETEWALHRRLFRLDNSTWQLGLSYSLSSDKGKKKTPTKGSEQEKKDVINNLDYYYDFDIPWSLKLDYNITYGRSWNITYSHRNTMLTQTLGFNGQINLTPKWKFTITSGWDFTLSELSFTNIQLIRDLHCWEMSFNWIPKGPQQSWNFTLKVKASILTDLKLTKKKDFQDYIQ
jgi:lipopolysaccharide assembly outer membrane protein LptD (OstA)